MSIHYFDHDFKMLAVADGGFSLKINQAGSFSVPHNENLRRFVIEAREEGAVPILVTSPGRRIYANGKLVPGKITAYVHAMKAVAMQERAPLIDLNARSFAYFSQFSSEAESEVSPKEGDATHFNSKGVEVLARFVMEECKKAAPEMASLFTIPPGQ